MSPILLFPIAILTPFIIAAALLAPIYAGILGATYVIYMPANGGPHPLTGKMTDVFYVLDVFGQLASYWMQHAASADFVHYTLPVVCLPLLGLIIALYVTYKISAAMLNIFHLTASH